MYDRHSKRFGGQKLDICLMELVLEKQLTKNLTKFDLENLKFEDINLHKRRLLLNSVKKSKKILSSNKEMFVSVEDFFEYRALQEKVTRAEFESYCEPVFEKLSSELNSLTEDLAARNLTFSKIEMLGGIVRIPKVQEIIKNQWNMPLGQHINGDDGMAMGASIIAANYSAGVRTKKIIMSERVGYSI